MKTQLAIFFGIAFTFFSCQTVPQGLTIKGRITNIPKDTKLYLEELTYTTRNNIDTAVSDAKGNFTMHGAIKNKGLYQLRISDQKAIFLVLDEKPLNMEINADTADITSFKYKLTGSPASDQLRKFIVDTKMYGETFGSAMNEYNLNVKESSPDSVKKIYENKIVMADSTFRLFATKYADTATNPIIAIFAATNLDFDRDSETFNKLATRLNSKYADLPFVQAYLQMVESRKGAPSQEEGTAMFAAGSQVPDIDLQDINGKSRKLSSLRGNVVLLDFWASWCGPCRRENPNVVKAYETYKDKGFTIYSVSLDTDKDKWIAGIKKDQLMWPNHVSDLQGWKSSVCGTYGIRAIPQNFLLDKDGKVIASNLRGNDLINTLQSVLQ